MAQIEDGCKRFIALVLIMKLLSVGDGESVLLSGNCTRARGLGCGPVLGEAPPPPPLPLVPSLFLAQLGLSVGLINYSFTSCVLSLCNVCILCVSVCSGI